MHHGRNKVLVEKHAPWCLQYYSRSIILINLESQFAFSETYSVIVSLHELFAKPKTSVWNLRNILRLIRCFGVCGSHFEPRLSSEGNCCKKRDFVVHLNTDTAPRKWRPRSRKPCSKVATLTRWSDSCQVTPDESHPPKRHAGSGLSRLLGKTKLNRVGLLHIPLITEWDVKTFTCVGNRS